jgi:hypothetical protein
LQFSAILIWYANIKAKRALKGGKRSCLILLLMHGGRTIEGMSKLGGQGGLGGAMADMEKRIGAETDNLLVVPPDFWTFHRLSIVFLLSFFTAAATQIPLKLSIKF